jgi:hypothetical protein
MLVELLLGLVMDALGGSPVGVGRQFERDLAVYLERRGFTRPAQEPAKPAQA